MASASRGDVSSAAVEPPTPEQIRLATVELLGAITYGQLRAFQATAAVVAVAPDVATADRVAAFAVREHQTYTGLRDHLATTTDLSSGVVDRQKAVFDTYFDAVEVHEWRSACALFAVGLPIAGDFGREIAPALPPETADVVVSALTDRGGFEQWAREQLQAHMTGDDDVAEVRRVIADMLGRALTGYQGVVADTDALQVLLAALDEDGIGGEALVRRVAVRVIDRHRRRMHALGIDDL